MSKDKSHPPTQSHNYLPKVIALGVKIPEAGSLNDVDVRHDDWCDVFRGGFCNCDPIVKLWPKAKH